MSPSRTRQAPLQPAADELERRRPTITEPIGPWPALRRPPVLVAGIYLGDRPNNVCDIVRELSASRRFRVEQRWTALGGEPPTGDVARVTVFRRDPPRGRLQLLNELLASAPLDGYELVLLCDDDVVLPLRFLDTFLELQRRLDLALAQPARTPTSWIDLPIVSQHRGVLARRTLYVEQGPVVGVAKSAFGLIFPLDETSPMGWGVGNVWSLRLDEAGLAMGIVDATPVDHSLRKPLAAYSWEEGDRGRRLLFAKERHRPTDECFRILDVVALRDER